VDPGSDVRMGHDVCRLGFRRAGCVPCACVANRMRATVWWCHVLLRRHCLRIRMHVLGGKPGVLHVVAGLPARSTADAGAALCPNLAGIPGGGLYMPARRPRVRAQFGANSAHRSGRASAPLAGVYQFLCLPGCIIFCHRRRAVRWMKITGLRCFAARSRADLGGPALRRPYWPFRCSLADRCAFRMISGWASWKLEYLPGPRYAVLMRPSPDRGGGAMTSASGNRR